MTSVLEEADSKRLLESVPDADKREEVQNRNFQKM